MGLICVCVQGGRRQVRDIRLRTNALCTVQCTSSVNIVTRRDVHGSQILLYCDKVEWMYYLSGQVTSPTVNTNCVNSLYPRPIYSRDHICMYIVYMHVRSMDLGIITKISDYCHNYRCTNDILCLQYTFYICLVFLGPTPLFLIWGVS